MQLKNTIYAITCLAFSIIIGAAVYEHLAVWPQAYAAPPSSLTMFDGDFALNSGAFWRLIHPIVLALFIITLILSWKSGRRKNVLVAFSGYVVILAVSLIYFVPELMDITGTAYEDIVDPDLSKRGSLWQYLSLIRLAALIGLSIILFIGLSKSSERVRAEHPGA